ncbi:hydroxyphenylacetyl-CoA thioesterase PaaI [Rhizobiaceae bacterium n13]|uniref:Hydroxyphenylacetyl-CoA thioesterase PaaI n=1 Tax=Ferirhizobium litorale TaxID=2927786 RepID=A0AAE3U5R8_9HYPH|nr:hydroxyphenylacetyl-CoA thioesterase PaaI [Fererhizobium litorale]MDI7862792.1 hydroxyphenylacetyl-CoA thioesterase PaaI [Fererhizobium litorale]MDI7924344.1 hydroxyphenylacetyl-CoA thioesterase PaaI [Fererhizobium litorale]
MTDDERASLSAETMWKNDRASRGLGMEVLSVEPGKATLSMTVAEVMTNGHGTAHGGFIFALADSAFAFACNSYGETTVAAHCSITYIRPGRLGDQLIAEAREVSRAGRSGIYDVRVSANGQTIAEFRGHSRSLGSQFIESP